MILVWPALVILIFAELYLSACYLIDRTPTSPEWDPYSFSMEWFIIPYWIDRLRGKLRWQGADSRASYHTEKQ